MLLNAQTKSKIAPPPLTNVEVSPHVVNMSNLNFKVMVRVIGYKERKNQEGKPFFTLVLEGGMEFIQSSSTGKFYATARRTSITSTFDENTCKAFIGKEMAGSIAKVPCNEYEYTIPETNEVISLTHHYVYLPEGVTAESLNAEIKLSAMSIGSKQIEASRYAA